MVGRADSPGPPGLKNSGPRLGAADGFRVNAMSSDALPGFSQSSGTFIVAHSTPSPQVCHVISCRAYVARSSPSAAGSRTTGSPAPS